MTDPKDKDLMQTADSGHGEPPPKNEPLRVPSEPEPTVEEQARVAADTGHGDPPPKGGGN